MIRLIIFILVFAAFLGFIVLNLDNKSDVSFGFTSFENVPVFLSALVSFTAGMLIAIPLSFSLIRKKKKKLKSIQEEAEASIAKNKKETKRAPFWKKASKEKLPELEAVPPNKQEYIKKEDSPYGID